MKLAVIVSVLAVAGAVLPAQAGTQVVAGEGITLTEAARIKFNRDAGTDDQQVAVEPVAPSGDYGRLAASFGMDPDEAEGQSLAGHLRGEGQPRRGRERPAAREGQRGRHGHPLAGGDPGPRQLAASAGVEPDMAAVMSLGDIAAVKFERGGAND